MAPNTFCLATCSHPVSSYCRIGKGVKRSSEPPDSEGNTPPSLMDHMNDGNCADGLWILWILVQGFSDLSRKLANKATDHTYLDLPPEI